ncbi:alpha/beta fold hydrolase [Aeromicrobium sp. CTD01-1L150]|uniref:alpha/beta fold hydrolase n=1 Tax=Aeromicrobium sp. CTD01-1L150 TaxID=3341830 RepID=UPI0035C1FDDC
MDTPTWFDEAIAEEPARLTREVDGASVAYRAWGRPGDPPVVLVHGGAAHGGWWDHVGPHLTGGGAGPGAADDTGGGAGPGAADDTGGGAGPEGPDRHRVLAIDLTGHGLSSHTGGYSLERWASEVVAVARAESDVPPIVIGHSMGGFVALTAARDHGSQLAGVVAIDSPVRQMSPEARAWLDSSPHLPPHKVHPTQEAILKRFRTLPEDDATLDFVRDHIAAESIVEVEGGWSWRFDPRIFLSTRMETSALAEAVCPVALLRGERGMATRDITAAVARELGGGVPVTTIPDAGHHVMLDQPVALIAAVNVLLGQWRRT